MSKLKLIGVRKKIFLLKGIKLCDEAKALFCVLLTFLSISLSIKSFTMHPADLITNEPKKNIINKIKILLDRPFVEDAKMKLIG